MTQSEIPNVALLIIATNKYVCFVDPLIQSADQYFLKNCNVTYCIFTDQRPAVNTKRLFNYLHIEHEPWPNPTLKRYDYINQYKDILSSFDYLFYCDADMKFVDTVGEEILSDLVGTLHPAFWNQHKCVYTYDRNPKSKAYMQNCTGDKYYAGGFNGGKSTLFLRMAEQIKDWRTIDAANDVIPLWHDESYLNKYLWLKKPTKILSPEYCYPENWNLPFFKKLIALDKNHKDMRD